MTKIDVQKIAKQAKTSLEKKKISSNKSSVKKIKLTKDDPFVRDILSLLN